MKRLAAAAAILLAVSTLAPTAVGAPPPPARLPDNFPSEVDGYDMRGAYSRWAFWVAKQYGPALEAGVDKPEVLPGLLHLGSAPFEYRVHTDEGPRVVGDVRIYCVAGDNGERDRSRCHYRQRRVSVAHRERGGEAMAAYLSEAFDPVALAQEWRRSGIATGIDWWRIDPEVMFAILPGPQAATARSVQIETLDSRNCPLLADAVEDIERQTVRWRMDAFGLGQDRRIEAPPPHSGSVTSTFRIIIPGGIVTITGDGEEIREMGNPIVAAMRQCRDEIEITQPPPG